MKPIKHLSIIAIGLLLVLWGQTLSAAQGSSPKPPKPDRTVYVPGELIVKFKDGVANLAAQRSLQAINLRPLEVSTKGRLLRVQVTPGSEEDTISQLMNRGDIAFASYNYYIYATETPNDDNYPSQWHLDQANDADIDAPEAWDLETGSRNEVIIAIIDSGIDLDHPEFKDKLVEGYNFIDRTLPPDDDFSHGTHVAGIAAAQGNNEIGTTGVSWYAKLMPLKVLDSDGRGTTFDMVQAIYYAIRNKANIINMSFSIPGSKWPCNNDSIEEAFAEAAEEGVLLIAVSGNDNQQGVNCYGANDEAISVGSTTRFDSLAFLSNYGERLDLVAPGESIYSTLPLDYGNQSGYGSKSGTSMAAPQVAGVAALLWSFEPNLTHHQVRDILESTADDLGDPGWDEKFGWGRVNAYQALESLIKVNIELDDQDYFYITDADDNQIQQVTISTHNPVGLQWTATVSPTVSWLEIASPAPATGLVSSVAPENLTFMVTKPITYGVYTTTLIVKTDQENNMDMAEIKLRYTTSNQRIYLPLVLNQ